MDSKVVNIGHVIDDIDRSKVHTQGIAHNLYINPTIIMRVDVVLSGVFMPIHVFGYRWTGQRKLKL